MTIIMPNKKNDTHGSVHLVPVLAEIIEWSEKHLVVHPMAIEFAKQLKTNKLKIIKTLFESHRKAINP